ncbi:hypothetical protein EXIGLDRAFT_695348 [Exidia glandulosa HHB12029]|uniref:F-box domain-containing protein n=1 Tax=Exidia glandulosa HHB12029 TaxID=1314781 RepID=A0A165FYZ1_EXIGL|nr:hypothetical protein EXIGLDRAFT_695348 [Exidia glandulosa HHB12029]
MSLDPHFDSLMGSAYSTTCDGMADALKLVRELPVEILGEIFLLSHGEALAAGDTVQPVRLAHVCRFFRQVAFGTPCLWRFLFIDDERVRDPDHQTHLVELWARNSAACPLDLHLTLHDPASFVQPGAALRLLALELPRVRHMALSLTDSEASVAIWRSLASTPALASLQFTIDPLPSGSLKYLNECSTVAGIVTSPGQRFAALPMAIIPKASVFPHQLAGLVHLKLDDSQWDSPCSATRILDFLELCPALEVFEWHGVPVDIGRSGRSIVSLPSLRRLDLKETCAARDLLSHIHVPALEELRMFQLNVSFIGFDDAYHEMGDSDDEAGDYSRSPYSDRLTGMGMRSLLRRCSPPLRFLDFDFVDMRTKDFLWCFHNLPYLEVFRVVASDMSDTVIRALSKPDARGVWPLPRLRHLTLAECNQITQKAVLSVIRARCAAGFLPATYDIQRCQRIQATVLSRFVRPPGLTVEIQDAPKDG